MSKEIESKQYHHREQKNKAQKYAKVAKCQTTAPLSLSLWKCSDFNSIHYETSNTFPLAEYAPSSNPISEDQAAPGSTFANLDDCLPNTAFGHSVSNGITGVV